jgi:hypothetical protein
MSQQLVHPRSPPQTAAAGTSVGKAWASVAGASRQIALCMSLRHRCQQADSHVHECETPEATETKQRRYCPPILPVAVRAGVRACGRAGVRACGCAGVRVCGCECACACALRVRVCSCVCALVESK